MMTIKERVLALHSAFPDASMDKISRIAGCSNKTVKYHINPQARENQHKRNLARNKRVTVERKLELITLRGGKCEKCGYDKCPEALHFHHKDPALKTGGIADLLTGRFDVVLEESKKCDLLCSNCHSELHASE